MNAAEEFLRDLQQKVEDNYVGIELWLEHAEWDLAREHGKPFVEWLQEVLKGV